MLTRSYLSDNKLNQRGFTLIELMVVVAILSIVSMLAGPSMLSIIKNNKLQSMNADFSSFIKFARAEAKAKGQTVIITTSDSATDWHNNEIIAFVDSNSNSSFDSASDWELRRLKISDDFVMTAKAGSTATNNVTFISSGFTVGGSTTYSFTLCDSSSSVAEGYQYDILASGLSYVRSFTCP